MAKTIDFTYDGDEYKLEFTRKSVQALERTGFKISEVAEFPVTGFPNLFAAAFQANHRFLKRERIDKMFDATPNKNELMAKLIEMYNEPLEALLDDEEGAEKNAEWGASF